MKRILLTVAVVTGAFFGLSVFTADTAESQSNTFRFRMQCAGRATYVQIARGHSQYAARNHALQRARAKGYRACRVLGVAGARHQPVMTTYKYRMRCAGRKTYIQIARATTEYQARQNALNRASEKGYRRCSVIAQKH